MQKSVYSIRYKRLLQALKDARISANYTQAEAAEKLHKPQSFVSKCESGERRIDVIEMIEFCKIYRLTPESILIAIDNKTLGKN